jgi:radical SAM protein with 4Fe4S-binding SPASM domain
MSFQVFENKEHKMVRSNHYNYNFNKINGHFERWGRSFEDDPAFAPSPEILDIEVTTICKGPNGKLCPFCYKSNNPSGHNMSFDIFKNIFDKISKNKILTQIAFGADAQATANPDLFKMMQYARSKDVIPNITVADIDNETALKLSNVCGAVAVSVYKHAGKDIAYNSIKRLSDAGLEQINIHFMLSDETFDDAFEIMNDSISDSRLCNLNAIVFLSLKQKGRGVKFNTISQDNYKKLVDYAFDNNISIGFDSCSAPTFINSVKDKKNFDLLYEMSEPCESTLFSSYINEHGIFFPCSFTENWKEGNWENGLSVLDSDDFVSDIWNHPKTVFFRNSLIQNTDLNKCRNCPAYSVCGIDMRLPYTIVNENHSSLSFL